MENLTVMTLNRWGALGAVATLLTCAAAFLVDGHVGAASAMACGGAACTATAAARRRIPSTSRRLGQVEELAQAMTWPALVLLAQTALAVDGSGNALLATSTGFLVFLYVGALAGASPYPVHRALWLLPIGLTGPALSKSAATQVDIIALLSVAAAWIATAHFSAWLTRCLEERGRRIHQLTQLADTDALTGLWNRRALTRDLDTAGDTNRWCFRPGDSRLGNPGSEPPAYDAGAIAILDLDDFKNFNDAHGHLAGDTLLVDFAAFLEDTVHSTTLVYRFGGEEFVLLLPSTPMDAATTQIEQLTYAWQRRDGRVTFSAGITSLTGDAADLEAADANLYLAKQAGRNLVIAGPAAPQQTPTHSMVHPNAVGGPGAV